MISQNKNEFSAQSEAASESGKRLIKWWERESIITFARKLHVAQYKLINFIIKIE